MFTLPILIFLNEPCPMFIICFCFCFVVFSVHSNCSEIWGLSTPNTIEQWDTSGLYSYPDQTRWLSSTIVWCCVQLWCGRVVITMLEVSYTENIFVSRSHHHSILSISISLPYPTILCVTPSPLCILHPSHHHLLFAVQSDHWMAACRSPTGRGFPMLSTAACGDGLTFTAIMSCEPSRPVSMPSTSKRMRSASTPTTTRGWRPQVRPQWTFVTF